MSGWSASCRKQHVCVGFASDRVTARTPAWVPAGVLRRWGGSFRGGGEFFAELQSGEEEVPLVQAICDELVAVTDPEGEARMGCDSPVISKARCGVLRLMDKLQPRDLGLSERDFQGLTHSLCMPVYGGPGAFFEMTVFVLPKGGEIPLHDHPNMAVLSRILFGTLDVTSYDIEDEEEDEAEEEQGSKREGGTVAGAKLRRKEAQRAVFAQRRQQQEGGRVTAATPSFLLTPSEGNVHSFRAPAACAVFDVLIPPYDSSRGRKCSYFRAETPLTSRNGGTVVVSARTAGADDGGVEGEREGGPIANDETAAAAERRRERVVLRQVPEPEGLPRWSRYYGPSVTLR
ncbi:unnamed protein product [Ectocarpus sp. 12 AP-2014]